jgi:hypothetical protein
MIIRDVISRFLLVLYDPNANNSMLAIYPRNLIKFFKYQSLRKDIFRIPEIITPGY